MLRRLVLLLAVGLLSGCAFVDRLRPEPRVEYIPVPESYLLECELPPAPLSNGELSEALVAAYQCAEQGNRDKRRIRELAAPPQS